MEKHKTTDPRVVEEGNFQFDFSVLSSTAPLWYSAEASKLDEAEVKVKCAMAKVLEFNHQPV